MNIGETVSKIKGEQMVILYGFFAFSFLTSGFVVASCILSSRISQINGVEENLSSDLEFQMELATSSRIVAPNGR